MPATTKAASPKSQPAKTTAAKAAPRTPATPAPKRATPAPKPTTPAAKRAAPATTAKPKAEMEAAPARRSSPARIDPDRRRGYVEVAAYFIAEHRGFTNGYETSDWLAAEAEIDRLLRENKLTV